MLPASGKHQSLLTLPWSRFTDSVTNYNAAWGWHNSYQSEVFGITDKLILQCGGPQRNVIFSFSSARCIRLPGFALIRYSCRCVIDIMLLHCGCCTSLIRTRIIACSVSFHLLLSEFDIPSCGCSSSIRV